MIGFEYYNPARIVFGEGSISKLRGLIESSGARSLLLVYSGEFIRDLGIFAAAEQACEDLGIRFSYNGEVVPNPSVDLVRKLADEGRENGVDFILAAGGGSAIDTAKAIALAIPYEGDVWDFFYEGKIPSKVLKVGVITTLPASGSETSNAAIISNGKWKLGFEDDRIIPQFAIMDPAYTLGLPAYQTSCGAADILSHLLERYFSPVDHTDVTDYLIEGAVRAHMINSLRLMDDPRDINARAEVQQMASIAHNNLLDTGRIGDWGSHRIEHELSAEYGLTHGEGMAVVITAWVRYAAGVKPDKPAQLALRVFGGDDAKTPQELALYLADKLEEFFRKLGLKTRLNELGIGEEHFEEMALRATRKGNVGHYIELDKERFTDVLRLAL